jgi:hypothetical protein
MTFAGPNFRISARVNFFKWDMVNDYSDVVPLAKSSGKHIVEPLVISWHKVLPLKDSQCLLCGPRTLGKEKNGPLAAAPTDSIPAVRFRNRGARIL